MSFFVRGVMSIINVTPDSFYKGSRNCNAEQVAGAIARARDEGATYVDLGGYSSRPGAEDISEEQELARLRVAMDLLRDSFTLHLPAQIEAVQTPSSGLRVTIDTFRSAVVERLLAEYGPCFGVNDISAGELDRRMIPLVAEAGLPYVAMHMRGTPQTMNGLTDYDHLTSEVRRALLRKLEECNRAGIKDVALDPGFGFAKTVDQNFELFGALPELSQLGAPLLVGVSRKSMIYRTLGVTAEESLTGTIALNWQALQSGASILRVHDTLPAVQLFALHDRYVLHEHRA